MKLTREERAELADAKALVNQSPRLICDIAADIRRNWPAPYFGAVPYLKAMSALNTVNDSYGADPAEQILRYFLSNAATWRGPEAKRLKTEIKTLLKGNK